MNPSLKRLAPLGLYLSLVAALAAAGLWIVMREFNLYVQIALGLVVIGLALFAILNPEGVRKAFTGRQAKYGSNALVMTLALLGILVVINFLIFKNPKRWDLTEDKEHTLAQETIETLKKLPEPVTATGFFTARVSSDSAKSLLEDFKYNADGKFDYKFIDPESDPVSAQEAGITNDGTIVVAMGGHQEKLDYTSEEELVSAIVRLSNPDEKAVYFLTGHGEYNPEGSGDSSYSEASAGLTDRNYTVKTLNLLATPQIPEDASLIVIAGPRKPVSEDEVKLIQDFLDKGGSLIAMLEPKVVTDYGDATDPLAAYLSETWGVSLDDDLVIDPSVNQVTVAVSGEYADHSITNDLNTNLMATLFPTARSLEIGKQDFSPVALVKTANTAWGETDMEALQNNQVQQDSGVDVAGPITLAVALENTTTKSRVVVFGDSDFAANGNFSAYGNSDIFENSVDWTAQQENLIELTPRQTTQRVMVTPQESTLRLIFLGSVVAIPLIVLVGGVFTQVQRRRRG